MNAVQKLKHLILIRHSAMNSDFALPELTAEHIDALYDEQHDNLQDARNEVRGGKVNTGLHAPSSRNYEPYEVAAKAPDGSYIGWTYWTGGGKHSNPEEIDFVEYAYDLTVTEETKTVVVQTFTKVEPAA